MVRLEEVLESIRTRPRTWLVTGVAGFIGSNLLETLLQLGQRVVGLDDFSSGHAANLEAVKGAVSEARWRRFRFIEGDIRSLDTCRQACRSVNRVLHEAALGSVPRSIDDPVTNNGINITGFLNMLVAAHDAGVERFVYAGSSAAYGDCTDLPMVERTTGRPLSPYGLTKFVDELYAALFAHCYGFDSIGLRYFNVFGPRQDPRGAYAAVIPGWIAAMIRNEPIFINGDGETTRDFCHVGNVVHANLLASTTNEPAAINQVYNVAMGGKTTLNQLFEMIRLPLETRHRHVRTLRPIYREFRAGDIKYSQADIGKARELLGYEPTVRVAEGLAQTIDWYATKLDEQQGTPALPRVPRQPAVVSAP